MSDIDISGDIAAALQLCERLKSGDKKALEDVVNLYGSLFSNFVRKRLYDSVVYRPEDVLMTFWEELMGGKIFCDYKAKGGISLKNYLFSILNKHIIDFNRKIERERNRVNTFEDPENETISSKDTATSPINEIIHKQGESIAVELINESLLLFSENNPIDAAYIKMLFLEELSYEAIAFRLTDKNADAEKVQKKTAAIRKQVTRKRFGSIAKFKIILERLMSSKNMRYEDI